MFSYKPGQILCVVTLLCAPAVGGVSTFENFSEGSKGTSFTDPTSGILFSNSTSLSQIFVVEYSRHNALWPLPMFEDNRYLTTNGHSPGDAGSIGAVFGFTGTLPQFARSVELDLAGSNSGASYSVSLIAQDGGGATLGSQTITFTSFETTQHHLRVDSPNDDIARFLLTTTGTGFNAVDNIQFVPEPSATLAAAALLVTSLRPRRRQAPSPPPP